MKKFMCKDFLLETKTAKKLYHEYAKNMPIFDYHCHLSSGDIAKNKSYKNITEIWLNGDHYKWRGMRSNGITEDYITGNKSDKEKFIKWAETVPYTIGNPLYHWTHLELKTYFGINETLSSKTSEMIWEKCNTLLQNDNYSARELIKRSNVKALCTTDDPIDSLKYHIQIKNDKNFQVEVLPTFRPDKIIDIKNKEFCNYIKKLSNISNIEILSYKQLLEAIKKRIDFFDEVGCRLSDHSVETFYFKKHNSEDLENIFRKRLENKELSSDEVEKYFSAIFIFLGKEYSRKKWAMQIHIGAIRNNSKRMFDKIGTDAGFDSIGDFSYSKELSKILDKMDETDKLPKTILYTLNPKDNYMLGAMIGNFQGNGQAGKIQFGSGWWFNDQRDGMIEQMKTLANLGLLSRFVGMLTDSRSFLSYTRHEYFRRILCNLIGKWVENGEYPDDYIMLKKIIEDICFNNINNYIKR